MCLLWILLILLTALSWMLWLYIYNVVFIFIYIYITILVQSFHICVLCTIPGEIFTCFCVYFLCFFLCKIILCSFSLCWRCYRSLHFTHMVRMWVCTHERSCQWGRQRLLQGDYETVRSANYRRRARVRLSSTHTRDCVHPQVFRSTFLTPNILSRLYWNPLESMPEYICIDITTYKVHKHV